MWTFKEDAGRQMSISWQRTDTMGAVGYAAWIVRVCHKRPQIPNPLHVQLVAFIRAPRLDALPFGMLGALRLHQRLQLANMVESPVRLI